MIVAFDSKIKGVSLKVGEVEVMTQYIPNMRVHFACLSQTLYRCRIQFILHFENREKTLYETSALDSTELRLFSVIDKMGYYSLNYNAKLQLTTLK